MSRTVAKQTTAATYYARKRNRLATFADNPSMPAWGSIGFAAIPQPGDTVTLNGVEIVFGSDVEIADTLADTINNLQSYAEAVVPGARYSAAEASLSIFSKQAGDTSFTLAASAASVSADHLELQRTRTRQPL